MRHNEVDAMVALLRQWKRDRKSERERQRQIERGGARDKERERDRYRERQKTTATRRQKKARWRSSLPEPSRHLTRNSPCFRLFSRVVYIKKSAIDTKTSNIRNAHIVNRHTRFVPFNFVEQERKKPHKINFPSANCDSDDFILLFIGVFCVYGRFVCIVYYTDATMCSLLSISLLSHTHNFSSPFYFCRPIRNSDASAFGFPKKHFIKSLASEMCIHTDGISILSHK